MTDDLTALARRLDELEKGQQELKESLARAESDRDAYHRLYLETMERCRKLELGLRGPKAERLGKDDK